MGTMGSRVRMLRQQQGLSQEKLGVRSGLDRRTVQRVEADEPVSNETVTALAGAFGVAISRLRFGFSAESLGEFEDSFLCPHCNSTLVSRAFVPYEDGEVEVEEFSCGYSRGWRERPCPKDPSFPTFEHYELTYVEESPGTWFCYAVGKTEAARAVDLSSGVGQTAEQAERLVRRSYMQVRDGYEAAEAKYPLFS